MQELGYQAAFEQAGEAVFGDVCEGDPVFYRVRE